MSPPYRPMTLANMRANGVRHVTASCVDCAHQADLLVDDLPADLFVPDVARKLKCSVCQSKRVSTRPAWRLKEYGWSGT